MKKVKIEKMIKLKTSGMSYARIGKIYKISRQAIHQLISRRIKNIEKNIPKPYFLACQNCGFRFKNIFSLNDFESIKCPKCKELFNKKSDIDLFYN